MSKPVLTKREFRRRYAAGEFGNRSPTWSNLVEYQLSGYRGLVHIRNGAVAGGKTFYNVASKDVPHVWAKAHKLQPHGWMISAMAPHHRGTIQGELEQSVNHLNLTCCSAKLPMREAMAKGPVQHLKGLTAWKTLEHYMDPPSYDWLQYLLQAYPGHVIEFSCFNIPWGTIPNRNVIWWEVRKY